MKLAKIFREGAPININLTLPENEVDILNAYKEAYENTHGDKISQGELIRHILKDYINSDKEFSKISNQKSGSRIKKKKTIQHENN